MIQVLKAKRRNSSRSPSTYHTYAITAKQNVQLHEEDLGLLEILTKSTQGSELDMGIDDVKMVLTKMNHDNAPSEAEATAIFRIADVVSPHDTLTVEELEAAMRFWRMIIPNRQKLEINFDSIYFGHTHEQHVAGMEQFFTDMGLDKDKLKDSEVERMLSLMEIDEEEGVVDRESARPIVLMEYIIQSLDSSEARRQTILDGFLTDENEKKGEEEQQDLIPQKLELSKPVQSGESQKQETQVSVSTACCTLC